MSGCATTGQGKTAFSIPTHGNFCGPGHPSVHNTTKVENIIELMTIKPLDDIDGICQRHDICYEVTGYFNQTCDAWLASEIGKLNFSYKDAGQQMYCKNVQYGITSSWGLASERTPTTKTGEPLSDAYSDATNYLLHQVGGYIAAGFNITLDAANYKLNEALGETPKQCNHNDNGNKGAYNPKLVTLLFYDSLIDIMTSKKYIDNDKATKLRVSLGIDTKSSYSQRWGQTCNMQPWKDNPVLSANWSLNLEERQSRN